MAALKAAFLLLMYSLYASARDSGSSVIRQDLNSNDWDISNQNGTIDVGPVQLPVMVLEALYNAGQLPDGDPISRCSEHVLCNASRLSSALLVSRRTKHHANYLSMTASTHCIAQHAPVPDHRKFISIT